MYNKYSGIPNPAYTLECHNGGCNATASMSVVLTGYHQLLELKVLDALGRTVSHAAIDSPTQGTTRALDLARLGTGLLLCAASTHGSQSGNPPHCARIIAGAAQ
ncbi:hypothetical protein [Hymenobacter sp. UYAg731]